MLARFTSGLLLALLLGACATSAPEPQQADPSLELGTVMPVPEVDAATQLRFDEAVTLLEQGRTAEAATMFQQLANERPELAGPWANLGVLHGRAGRQDDALAAYDMALTANPRNCTARVALALHSRHAGRFGEAESHYLACIDGDPGHAVAYHNLAVLYELYLGRLNDALDAYAQYQSLQSEPDAQVAGWMIDLERRIAAIAKR